MAGIPTDGAGCGVCGLARTSPTVETARGRHVYFRGDFDGVQHLAGGELRGARSYCLLPPSLHPDGVNYRWIIPPTPHKLIEVPLSVFGVDLTQDAQGTQGNWTYSDSRHEVFNNFYDHFSKIRTAANLKKHGTFHDLRRTALSNWRAQGVSEYELMTLAGHSSFQTTHEFYLSVKKDHLDKARRASNKGFARVLVEPVESGTIAEDDSADE